MAMLPQAPPGMMTPGAPPAAPQQPNPMAMLQQLAQRGQGGALPPEAQMLLMFLAGMGYETFANATQKLRGDKGKSANAQQAQQNPGQVLNPMLAKLAAMRAGGMGGMPVPGQT